MGVLAGRVLLTKPVVGNNHCSYNVWGTFMSADISNVLTVLFHLGRNEYISKLSECNLLVDYRDLGFFQRKKSNSYIAMPFCVTINWY